MTTLNGTLTTCGPGQYFSLQFTCNGPSCAGLSGFPNTTCTADATNTILTCSNGVTCPGPTNYTANFNLSQTTDLVTQSQQILLPDFCEEIDVTSNGTTGGVNAQMIITGSCGPPTGNNTLPSGSSTSSSSTTSSVASSSSSSTSKTGAISASSSSSQTYSTSSKPSTSSGSSSSNQASKAIVTVESIETVTTTTCPASGSTGSATTKQTAFGQSTASTTYGSATSLTSQIAGSVSTQITVSEASTASTANFNKGSASGSNSASTQSGATGAATASTKPSSAAAGNVPSNAITTSSTASTPASGQASGIVFTGGSSSIRNHISLSPFKLISFIFCFLFFIQGTAAFSPRSVPDIDISPADAFLEIKPSLNVTSLELFKRELTPGWKQFADLFAEWLADKISNPELADNLVDVLAEAVCDHAVGVAITDALGVDLVEECVAAIDIAGGLAALGTLQPEVEFAAVLGSGVLCNLLISDALPGIGQLTDAICSQEKPCSEDLLTDVNNCGQCNNTVNEPFWNSQ